MVNSLGMDLRDLTEIPKPVPADKMHQAALAIAGRVESGVVRRDEVRERLDMLGLLASELERRSLTPNIGHG